jgi:uncharacterized repeat protein (TIGR01451 family)
LAAVILTAPVLACAGINSWTGIGPDGGQVRRFAYSPSTPATVYVIAEGGLFRSRDGGAHWAPLKQDFAGQPFDVDVDPSDPDRLYVSMGTVPGFYYSTDGGTTLQAGSGFPTSAVSQLEVSADGKTLYAATSTGFLRSDDRGVTWQARTAPNSFAGVLSRLLIDPTDKQTLYALAPTSPNNMGLFVTHDGGATNWTQLMLSSGVDTFYDIAISPSNHERVWLAAGATGLYMRSDAAHAFTQVSTFPGNNAVALAINPLDATNVFVGDNRSHIHRTNDEGTSWQDVTGNSTASSITAIAVSPAASGQRVLLGSIAGIDAAATTGSSWAASQDGFVSTRIFTMSADPRRDHIYLNSAAALHSIDGGADRAITLPGTAALRTLVGPVAEFSISSVLAQDDGADGRLLVSATLKPARSFDQGDHWSPSTAPGLIWGMASTSQNPQVLLAAGTPSLARSTDGGATWVASTSGLPAGAFVDKVAFAPSDPLVAYAAPRTNVSFGIYRSDDAGVTWSAANAQIADNIIWSIAVDPTDARTVYVGANSFLWKTTNGGSSWTQLSSLPLLATALAVDPDNHRIVYASSTSAVSRSIDGGATWQNLRGLTAAPAWTPDVILPDPRRSHVLLVGTQGFGVQQMMIEPDLSLKLDAPPSVLPRDVPVAYRYTVSNAGPYDATDVRASFMLPAGAQNASVDSTGGSCATANQTIACTFSELRTGASQVLTVRALPPPNSFRVVASVQAAQPDPVTADNAVTSEVPVIRMSDVAVTATGPSAAHTGDAVSYTLTVNNAGPSAATDVQVTFDLATGLTPGTTTGATCTVVGSKIGCDLGELAAAASKAITVNATAATVGTFASTATVATSATDQTGGNNSASVSTAVTAPVPPSSGGGGGGSMSPIGLLMLGLILALRIATNRRVRRNMHLLPRQ